MDRIGRLLSLLGDPHLAVRAVHIAGTKGKGSTAVMTASVLQAAGLRTGLYTSPHLERIEERIVVDGRMCPENEFLHLAEMVQPAVEQLDREAQTAGTIGPTFFEVTTAMAFLHFARSKVDLAVLEVGLGGRLDSTNICQPEVCIITSISFDHTKQLGSTLAAIAREKAGIIKPGVPVISGVLDPEPRDVIRAQAQECAAPLFERGTSYDFDLPSAPHDSPTTTHHSQLTTDPVLPAETFHYREQSRTYALSDLHLGLVGRHQCANAAAAVAALRRLAERGWPITEDAVRRGLANARCPARIEQVAAQPAVIMDVAHNVASIEAVVTALSERYSARRRIAIFASSKDKDYREMLARVLSAFDVVILTQYVNNPRAQSVEELLSIALELRAGSSSDLAVNRPVLHASVHPAGAWRLARHIAQPDDLICITGSFFLAAEMREFIQKMI